MLLSVSDRHWQQPGVAWKVLEEGFDRQARWVIRADRSMAHPDKIDDARLLSSWFAATETSRKLKMFQAYFLTKVARPAGRRPSDVLGYYSRSYGRPGESMVRGLRRVRLSLPSRALDCSLRAFLASAQHIL